MLTIFMSETIGHTTIKIMFWTTFCGWYGGKFTTVVQEDKFNATAISKTTITSSPEGEKVYYNLYYIKGNSIFP